MMMIMMMMFSLSAPAYLTGHGGILHGYQNRLLPALEVSSMYRGADTFDSIARATSGCNTTISNESKDYAATSIV